ncbi:MAG TPA: hypothetical protein VJY43_04020 [Methanocorpusculum sp.]|nr:hypothetical protein [Methanocorpusculum sp.]
MIGTSLLIALSVVLISVVTLSVISGVGSFETLEHKVVGFTVEVNDTGYAVVMPVSGKDLPYLLSYTVYTDTGTSFSSDCDPCKVYRFNENVTYVNIVGNFSDGITALVFSGRVNNDTTIEGSTIVDDPGFMYNSDGYASLQALATDINNWYHAYYNTADDAASLWHGNGKGPQDDDKGQKGETHFVFKNSRPIIIASPLEISTDKIVSLATHDESGLQILIRGNGNFIRAPGYTGSLLIFGYVDKQERKGLDIVEGDFVIDGDGQNTPASKPAVVIAYGAPVSINGGKLTVINNINTDGNGGGIYIDDGGLLKIDNKGTLIVTGNSAGYGGGMYIDNNGTLSNAGTLTVSGNTATVEGNDIYSVPFP